ncbi:NAD(P)H-dependent oxidoreductase [Roseomonas sp. HJA6]|uniref:NAD(P)H-dependent oxidoreductase n=1 Tax=Roseomonas alba TaxID=2846776 RepID=A0ABS7A4S7_9PROT|nr:NAD(P)H-dependent oxidoreductase [Neoroseomonas alba]MBW6397110.1 NAD(P)H-dependent oxidoreductase [Neoroseomonas alba]
MAITVAVIVGSLRKGSFNGRLASALKKLGPADFTFTDVRIDDLPLYNQDDEATPAAAVTRFRDQVRAAQGVIFVTPEYNRGMPGGLKNALDQGSRPYGKSVWAGRPAGVVGTSPGAIGSALAQHDLRGALDYLDMPTLGQPEVYLQYKDGLIAEDGTVTNEGTAQFLQGWMDRYAAWIRRFA